MPHPRPLRPDPHEEERRHTEIEHDQEEAAEFEERVERAAERASLPFWHPAVHRMARRERARRHGSAGEEAAA